MTRDQMEKWAAEDAYEFWQAIFEGGREAGERHCVDSYRAVRAEVLREAARVCRDLQQDCYDHETPEETVGMLAGVLDGLADADDPNLGTPAPDAVEEPDLPEGWGQ